MPRIDYDTVAAVYDERLRDHPLDPRLTAFVEERRDRLARPARVLDIGCGTGKQLAANREHLPSLRFIGVDRSMAMLRVAQRRCPAVPWIHGDATLLPIACSSIDYACSQFVHAHVGDKQALLLEAHRVLVPGGRFVLTNIDPWSMEDWILYRYFPAALERDRIDFVPALALLTWIRDAGFQSAHVERDVRTQQMTVREFLAFVSSRHRASQLTAISDEEYARGLERLRQRAASEPDAPEPFTLALATFVAEK